MFSRMPDAAKGSRMRNAVVQRRKASVHGRDVAGHEAADHDVRREEQRHQRDRRNVAQAQGAEIHGN